MRATRANMKAVHAKFGDPPRPGRIVAYSPLTLEECSADPGDYFLMGPGECLLDSEGQDMILCLREPARLRAIRPSYLR